MDARVEPQGRCDPAAPASLGGLATTLIHARQTVLPKRLAEPGPSHEQLVQILSAAASAPDHKQLLPWRFVVIPPAERAQLGEVFAGSLLQRDAAATAEQVADARDKALRSPCLLVAICDTGEAASDIPAVERLVSAGCAIQNLLLQATALGFGSGLTSGKAMTSGALRRLFSLSPTEVALCFMSIGTPTRAASSRERPGVERYVTALAANGRLEPLGDQQAMASRLPSDSKPAS